MLHRGEAQPVSGERGRFGSSAPDAAKGLSLAFEFAGAVVLFWFLGKLVDGWLGTAPWGQIVGSVLGWIGGFLHVYYATQRRQSPRSGDDGADAPRSGDRADGPRSGDAGGHS